VSDASLVRAAGGIVIRGDGADPRVALVHRPRYDDWTFPKGKLDRGESDERAALREVYEETGIRCRLGAFVGAVTYRDRNGRPKVVRYWVMSPGDDGAAYTPTDEVDDVRWIDLEEAAAVLTYPHDRDLLRSFLAADHTAPLYVIRHAKAGSRDTWAGADEDRPLTIRGRRQAEGLVERFRGLELERIVSSPFRRCVGTVQPLARAHGLEIERADALREGADVDMLLAFVRGLDGRATALCGHGVEIDAIVDAFARAGAELEGDGGLAKGSIWVLDRRGDAVVSARYLPAPTA
jgi:8-oxo-dGTP diphosphatase